jgi:hypothetical protein
MLLTLLSCAPTPDQGWPQLLDAGQVQLALHEDGTLSMSGPQGPVLEGGFAEVRLDHPGADGRPIRTTDARARSSRRGQLEDAHGSAEVLELLVAGGPDEPALCWTFAAYDQGLLLAELSLTHPGEEPLVVHKISTLRVDGEGGLFLGEDPARHRVLENGSFTVFDFLVEVRPGDVPDGGWAALAPGSFEGHSVSNWSHAIVDLDSEAAWVAGGLGFASTMPVMELSYEAPFANTSEGRRGFTFLSATGAYLPAGKVLQPGGTMQSERLFLEPASPDALLGLERYAQAVADDNALVPWHRREPGRAVPNGWNSWSGSGSSGGYGTDIDEALILENLDVVATYLRDFGFDWFQIDDGYQVATGDWEWREDRFPNGPAWLTERIRERGLIPGLWMSPFTLDPNSATAQEHPEWLAEKTAIGSVVGGSDAILDLTHPEAQAWLTERARVLHEDWGFDWMKLDFGYYALFGQDLYDDQSTREEAWTAGMAAVREGLGPDAFLLQVGPNGLNWPVSDSGRTTLDNMPIWDWDPALDLDDRMDQQGLKPTMRTAGRRWFVQDRVWINHPDLIFFRSNPHDESWPRLAFEEARVFCSFVGLSGGIVKLGDRLVDLEPEHLDTLRRLVPSHPTAARPLDVFEREFPEVYRLDLETPEDGLEERWTLFGLFDLGLNVDTTTQPYTVVEDDLAPTTHVIDLAEQGLEGPQLAYEFWTQEFLGVVTERLSVEVPSHDGRVVALRPLQEVPQLLGWNRQISMGGTLVHSSTWSQGVLTVTAELAGGSEDLPFPYEVAVYVPEGFTPVEAGLDADLGVVTQEWVDEGEVVRLLFELEPGARLTGEMVFRFE